MTSLLGKSRYLICFYMMIAIFSTLSFSVFLSMYERAGILHDGISQDSILVRFDSSNESLIVNDFLNVLKESEPDNFLIYRDSFDANIRSFYLWNHEFPLEMNWLEDETDIETGIVLIDKVLFANARYEDGRYYLWYRGYDYQVIGTFQLDVISGGTPLFFPMDLESPLFGIYVVDGLSIEAISSSVQQLQELDSNLTVQLIPLERTFADRMLIVVQASFFVVISLVLALIFIGLGTMTHTVAWMELRQNEIDVRYLVGATTKRIQRWLLKEYVFIISGSFIFGCFISFLIWQTGLFHIIMPDFHLLGIGFAFMLCLVLGVLTEGISTQLNGRKRGVLRKEKAR
ncbi:MAG: hypothetical protein FWG67_02335 [Defluviitaleaceae bacterium]|nr:hypothetical protein [Defluviitaleaceae bacterium]